MHVVAFAVGGGLHENVHCFLKGASHETTQVLTIDAVTRDGHQVTLEEIKEWSGYFRNFVVYGKIAIEIITRVRLQ